MREILGGPSACLLYLNKYNALRHSGRVRFWGFARALQGLANCGTRPQGCKPKDTSEGPPSSRSGRAALSLIAKVLATHPFANNSASLLTASENVKLQTNISSEFFVTHA
jgi:hypothetical protein